MTDLLRVDVQNGNVVFDLPDGGSRRPSFLRRLNVMFDCWINRNKAYTRLNKFSDEKLMSIGSIYSEYGCEITERARKVIDGARARQEEVREQKKESERKERIIRNAKYRLRNGCSLCEYHARGGYCTYAKQSCRTSPFEEEIAFEEFKERGRYGHTTPYPVKGCYWLEEARKITEQKK